MNKEEQLTIVEELLEEGYGRRKIAKSLGITEWRARSLMQDVIAGDYDLNPKKASKEKEIRRITKFKTTKRNKPSKATKTEIKVTNTSQPSDVPAKIDIKDATLKVAVLSDVHYPYEDQNAIKVCKAYLQDYQPDVIVFNGDITDCYTVSRYEKNVRNRPSIQDELDYTHDRLAEWVKEFPETEFKFVEGNHEERLRKHIMANAAELITIRDLAYPVLVGLEGLGIEWIPSDHDLQIGDLMFVHGFRARKHAGTTARAHFEDYGCSVLIGHIHRLSVAWKRNKFGNHALIENGTLCDFDVEYAKFPDWQQGFTTVDFDGNDFAPTQHAISNYRLIAGGKSYTL